MKKALLKVSIFGAATCLVAAAAASIMAWRAMRDVYRELHRYDEEDED